MDGVVRQTEAIFTPEFLAGRKDLGLGGSEAIFIVGMPRSGSTLIEQILASHPLVEGLGELFELQNSVTRIVGANPRTAWPETIANLTANELRALGQRYLSSTRRHRRTNRSEEHTSELQSLMRISYAVFCLKKKKITTKHSQQQQ